MIIRNHSKRLAIYFFYDKRGIVDKYIPYFLEDLRKNVEDIFIVCNGKLQEEGRIILKKYGEILIRKNEGYDVWAYKESLQHFGWDSLSEYDEIIMLNSTIMGPVFPLKETFDKMDKRDLDFWGITEFSEQSQDPSGYCRYGYIPNHIQSHFIACRKSLVKSIEFQRYWNEMPMINSYWESVGKHEMTFTKYFEDLGYKSGTSISTRNMKLYSGYPLMMCPTKLMQEQRCPIFKRKMFFNDPKDFLSQTTGEQVEILYNYLKLETEYDIDFIWETILRNYNHADIVKNLNLTYILSEKFYDTQLCDIALKKNRVVLVMHLFFEDLLSESLKYARAMPETSDIYITTDTKEKKKAIENIFSEIQCNYLEIRVIENRGRDVSSLLVGVKDIIMNYDIACFVHDKKTSQVVPGTAGAGFSYKCFQNTLGSKAFVMNIIATFEDNSRLGILSPPEPNHGPFFPTLGKEWRGSYLGVKELAKKLKITVPISKTKPPIAPYGSMFWFRPKAMKPLYDKNWEYSDFLPEPNKEIDDTISHAIERIHPFVVQQSGYYPGIVMSDSFAKIEYGNLKYYVREYNKIMMKYGIESFHQYMCEELERRLELSINPDSLKAVLKRRCKNRLKSNLPEATYEKVQAFWKKNMK